MMALSRTGRRALVAMIACILLLPLSPQTSHGADRSTATGLVASADKLPELATLPDFTLTNRDGRVIHKSDLLGHVWIMDFIFTNCTQYCQLMTYQLNKMREQLKNEPNIHYISVSVDPTRDSPQALERYAKSKGADADDWLYLTGDRKTLLDLLRTLTLVPKNTTTINPGMHTTFFVLLDKNAEVRGFYERGADDAQQMLMHDAKELEGVQTGVAPAGGTPTPHVSAAPRVLSVHGVVKKIETDRLAADIQHEDIPALEMKAMTMSYRMADARVLEGIQAGDEVQFTLTESPQSGDFVVTQVVKAARR